MPSEIDINLIFLRLERLEERIRLLEADVKNLKPDDYYQAKADGLRLPLEENSDNNPGHPRPFISTKEFMK